MPSKTRKSMKTPSGRNSAERSSNNLLMNSDSNLFIESLLGSSAHSSINVSRRSEGKRKSLLTVTDSQEANAEEGSDSETRNEEEKELWNELRNEKISLSQNEEEKGEKKSNDFLSLVKKHKSPEELETHYSQCIDLFSKNKVSAKNAFKLQLIDCMRLIMDEKTEKSENLTLMSCTLDASAKIYSCRVDNVYNNMIKYVRTYETSGKKKNKEIEKADDSADESRDDDGSDHEKIDGAEKEKKDKKKSKNLKSFIRDPESFQRKEVKIINYRQNLPRNQIYFLESPFLDGQLVLNRPLFATSTPRKSGYYPIGSVWSQKVVTDNLEDKIPGYSTLRSKICLADDGPEEEIEENMDNPFTFDPSIKSIAEMRPFSEVCDGQSSMDGGDLGDPNEVELDYDDCEPDPVTETLPTSNLPTPRVSFAPVSMTRMLRSAHSKHSDYSYFDDSKLACMPSASHWKLKHPKRSISDVGKTPAKTRRNVKSYLHFSNFEQSKHDMKMIQEDCKQKYMLAVKTTKDWFYKKTNLILKPNIPNVRKNLLSFVNDPDACILKKTKIPESSSEEFCVNDSILLDPQGFNSSNILDDDRGDDHPGDYHPLEDWSEKMNDEGDHGKQTFESENPEKSSLSEVLNFDNNALVSAPKRVEKLTIKFAKAQKRIDIKKLKLSIWNLLGFENNNPENKENEEGRSSKEGQRSVVKFSEIYSQIPSKISAEAAAQLSFPIAFMAILHMANERILKLTGNEDNTDFTVTHECI